MLAKRVIPCLDVDRGRVVKGTNFLNLRDAGNPVEVDDAILDEERIMRDYDKPESGPAEDDAGLEDCRDDLRRARRSDSTRDELLAGAGHVGRPVGRWGSLLPFAVRRASGRAPVR